jgi:antitoxin component of MazEF toxin-antitoxin module
MDSFFGKVRKNGDNHYISIPKNVVDALGLAEEDILKITLEKQTRIIEDKIDK